MPFDQTGHEPTDPTLRCLMEARAAASIKWEPRSRACIHTLVLEACGGERAIAFWGAGRLIQDAVSAEDWNEVYNYNDRRATKADVIDAFDRAIAARKAELLKADEMGAVGPQGRVATPIFESSNA